VPPPPPETKNAPEGDPGSPERLVGCLLRFFWGAAGLAVLWYCMLLIGEGSFRGRSFPIIDVIYWTTVVVIVVVRYVHIKYLKGDTYHGEPATMRHFRRYALWLLLLAIAAWLLVHGMVLLRSG
jgi:hypothetical protein